MEINRSGVASSQVQLVLAEMCGSKQIRGGKQSGSVSSSRDVEVNISRVASSQAQSVVVEMCVKNRSGVASSQTQFLLREMWER